LSIKNRILSYALIALLLVIGYQQVVLWIKGEEISSVVSLYRHKPAPRVIPPEAPRKGEQVVTLPCVPLQVIQPVIGQPDASEGHYTIGRWDIPLAPRGGLVVVESDKVSGEPKLTFTPAALGLAELGKSRYATLWAEYALNSESEKKLSLKLEAEIDLFRLGPLWTRGRGGIYYSSTTLPTNERVNDVGVFAGIGVGVGF
jgi:hypothetical protein